MVTPLSEDDARAALLQAKSEASNADNFAAFRRDQGWLFGWRRDRGRPPVGTNSWIVADNGAVKRLGFQDLAEDVIRDELAR